tara:strand:+ start:20943 stop:21308 length:366 start_codon:yes stop_codon:yes gene_type:complete
MKKNKVKKQVLGFAAPKKAEDSAYHDKNCPFTGTLPVKRELIKGIVVKKDSSKSATIMWERSVYVPKYERYQIKRSRLRVHNPPCLDAEIGQFVVAARTRPISKTKNHVIINITENETGKK